VHALSALQAAGAHARSAAAASPGERIQRGSPSDRVTLFATMPLWPSWSNSSVVSPCMGLPAFAECQATRNAQMWAPTTAVCGTEYGWPIGGKGLRSGSPYTPSRHRVGERLPVPAWLVDRGLQRGTLRPVSSYRFLFPMCSMVVSRLPCSSRRGTGRNQTGRPGV
jgi:hypothetical protein